MIEWVVWVILAVALAQALLAVGFSIAGSPPNDYTLGATALLALLVVAQVVVTITLQVTGASPTGDIVEYWAYLATAVFLAPAGIVWGLIERSRWSTLVLAIIGFSLAVMVYRMYQIWFIQVA